MKIKIVLPAFNEEECLQVLLDRISLSMQFYNWNVDVLVVNDGSTDNTSQIGHNYTGFAKVQVLDLNPNRGLAGAVRAGIDTALESEHLDVVVILDADDSQNPYLIDKMVQLIAEGSDIVIASRYQTGARIKGLSLFRKSMSYGASILFRLFVGLEGVRDYTCGFRAYNVKTLREVSKKYGNNFITQKGFGCMLEILMKIGSEGAIINEVPMILRYDQKLGDSKMDVKKTVKQTLRLLLDYKLKRLLK
jgi:dolichol-phosphate mannosyltransferase